MYFRFLALDSSNNIVRGTLHAGSRVEAESIIGNNGLTVKLLQEISDNHSVHLNWRGNASRLFKKKLNIFNFKKQFFQQMYLLLKSGINTEKAIQLISSQYTTHSSEVKICEILLKHICAGKSLSAAMSALQPNFTFMEINVVRAAEHIGRPQEALYQLSEVSQTLDTMKTKFVLSMIYPCIVIIVSVFVMMLLGGIIIPQFQELFFEYKDLQLPLLTRIVVNCCNFFGRNYLKIICGLLLFVVVVRSVYPQKIKTLWLKAPIVSKIVKDYNIYLFTVNLGTLLTYGINLQQGIAIAKNVVSEKRLKNLIEMVIDNVRHGTTISHSLSMILPRVATGIIVAGEKTGEIDKAFIKVSEIYREKLLERLNLLSVLIEPILIIIIAMIVGVVVVAMFLPLIDLMQHVKM